MNGNGHALSRESEIDRILRTQPTKTALRAVINALDAQAETLGAVREATAENTLRLNEHDGYVATLHEKIKAQEGVIAALTRRLDALEADQSELAANQV